MQVDRPSLLSSHSEPESAPLMYITHKLTINAVHRLWSNSLSEANNSDTYGTGLSLHGHTYKFSVTFRGPLCKATGQIYAAALLEDCVKLAITEVMDRKNLDTDISWFQNRPSTLENVAMFVWRNVAVILTPHPHDVEEVRVKTDGCARDRESSGRIDCVVASYRASPLAALPVRDPRSNRAIANSEFPTSVDPQLLQAFASILSSLGSSCGLLAVYRSSYQAFLSSLRSKVGGSSSPVHSDPDADKASSVDDGFEKKGDVVDAAVPATNELTLQEGQAGGLGRHLGVFSTTLLVVGRIIGTGIFSTPSSILTEVGSLGAAMMLWVLGLLLSFAGLCVWLELATIFPRSGGEKVYLEAIYRKPKLLATILYAANAILLGFTAAGCIVFASNILTAAHVKVTNWNERGIAIGVIVFVTIIHGFTPKLGVKLMNVLGIFKIAILLLVVVSGWVVLGGHVKSVPDPHYNFRNGFAGSSHSAFEYATALFKVLNSFSGWSNAAYVLNEVKDPVRTIKIAGPLGLGICSILYILANISYFAAVTIPELKASGVTVASFYFKVVFGETAQRALSVFVALSALGNVMSVTFAQSRVNQELGKEGFLPFTKFWASNWPVGAPLPGLIVHLIPSVVIILGPPAAVAYPFILDVEGYPGQIINLFVVVGLLWLRFKRPDIVRPFRVWLPVAFFFLVAAVFLLVVPFLRPAGGIGDTPPLPYWLYPIVGIAIFAVGLLYWFVWRIVLPKVGKYRLEPTKVVLPDGTVVTQYEKIHNE